MNFRYRFIRTYLTRTTKFTIYPFFSVPLCEICWHIHYRPLRVNNALCIIVCQALTCVAAHNTHSPSLYGHSVGTQSDNTKTPFIFCHTKMWKGIAYISPFQYTALWNLKLLSKWMCLFTENSKTKRLTITVEWNSDTGHVTCTVSAWNELSTFYVLYPSNGVVCSLFYSTRVIQ
jgi:hypothetical protein